MLVKSIINNMFGLKKNIPYLSLQEIYDIVESYLESRLPEVVLMLQYDTPEDKIKTLASTPQWTLIQTLDNFYISQQNKKAYEILLRIQSSSNGFGLPNKLPAKSDYLLPFYTFCLSLRSYADEDTDVILNKAKNIILNEGSDVEKLIRATRLMQEFELTNDNPNYTGSTEDDHNIKRQLNDNYELYQHYIKCRPEIKTLF